VNLHHPLLSGRGLFAIAPDILVLAVTAAAALLLRAAAFRGSL
jgi:hypothetical protein